MKKYYAIAPDAIGLGVFYLGEFATFDEAADADYKREVGEAAIWIADEKDLLDLKQSIDAQFDNNRA